MKSIDISHLDDLASLAIGVEILSGRKTQSLWVRIEKLEVLDMDSRTIGHFIHNDETERIEFVPVKT